MSKLVAGETQDHQPMGVLALQLVELAEVPGGGASERRHILDQHHAAPVHVEIHRVPLQRGGLQVVERLGDERHLRPSAPTLAADLISACLRPPTARLTDRLVVGGGKLRKLLSWVSDGGKPIRAGHTILR